MERRAMPHFGSYQFSNFRKSDDTKKEMWDILMKMASKNHYEKRYIWETHPEDKAEIIEYSISRIIQAKEFYDSASTQSLIAKPLLSYYSMLNLLRTLLALMNEAFPGKAHGLKYTKKKEILDSSARICPGTFNDWLSYKEMHSKEGMEITLKDAIEHIIEFGSDLEEFSGFECAYEFFKIRSNDSGELKLEVPIRTNNFENSWKTLYPELIKDFKLIANNALQSKKEEFSNYKDVTNYINSVFLTDLNYITYNDEAIWYLYKKDKPVYPRLSYYIIALFILSNIVRYEPELLLNVIQSKDAEFWVISKLLRLNERYFPQLIINEMYKTNIYYGIA